MAVGLEQAVCSVSCLAWQHRFTRERKSHGHGSSPQRANVLGCIRARGAWRGNGSTRPVLKHGPESLTCMQACGCIRLLCTMKVTAGIMLSLPLSLSLSPSLSNSLSTSVRLSPSPASPPPFSFPRAQWSACGALWACMALTCAQLAPAATNCRKLTSSCLLYTSPSPRD